MSILSNYLVETLLREMNEGVTALFPGGFKPPHGGHLELALRYAEEPKVQNVIVLIGPGEREGVTRDQSVQIWQELTKTQPKILIQKTEVNSPLAAAYKYIETAKPGNYTLVASSKGEDYRRVVDFVKGHQQGEKYARPEVTVIEMPLDTKPLPYAERSEKAVKYVPGKSDNGKGISASVLRADLKNQDKEAFATNYPNVADTGIIDRIFDILKKNTSESLLEDMPLQAGQYQARPRSRVYVTKKLTGKVIALTPKQYTTYMPDEGDSVDYSRFTGAVRSLTEGGAAGHLAHPYEDMDLTFGEIKQMIQAALGGKLEYAQEKLDGQNLMITYKDGVVRAARNKGQVKNYGENSLTTDQISNMFAGRGAIQTAFVETMKDLETAIQKLSPAEKADFFKNGQRFISLEVLFPETTNVIPYGAAQLRLHHFKDYDVSGNIQDEDVQGIYELQKVFDLVQASQQKTFMIRNTDPAKIKADIDLPNQLKQFSGDVDKVSSKYKLSDGQPVSEYVKRWWTDLINKKASELQYKIPKKVLDSLVTRWAFTNKSIKITDIKNSIQNDAFRTWVNDFDKTEVESNKKIALKPIELLFLRLGVRVLQNIENLTALSPDEATRKIKQDVSAAIRGIQKAADTETIQDSDAALKFLKRELTRLKDIGGFKAIVPTEGLVFKYKGKLFKLTGAFAPINQLLGYLRF